MEITVSSERGTIEVKPIRVWCIMTLAHWGKGYFVSSRNQSIYDLLMAGF